MKYLLHIPSGKAIEFYRWKVFLHARDTNNTNDIEMWENSIFDVDEIIQDRNRKDMRTYEDIIRVICVDMILAKAFYIRNGLSCESNCNFRDEFEIVEKND